LTPDREGGLLVDPGQPTAIAAAIISLLQDRELASRLGANGRNVVQRQFSWPVLSRANEEFYRRCLEQFKAAADKRTAPQACSEVRSES
jgi:glycosyltransferase involved in cell wall biosynthesis